MDLNKLISLADKLCNAAKTSYALEGLRMTELLLAINEYDLAREKYEESLRNIKNTENIS